MIHPRIDELIQKLKGVEAKNTLSLNTLELLKGLGATRTEATIVIHQGFGISDEKADDFVLKSNVWPAQVIQEVFYETLKYMNYKPDDQGYSDDGNTIKVSLY